MVYYTLKIVNFEFRLAGGIAVVRRGGGGRGGSGRGGGVRLRVEVLERAVDSRVLGYAALAHLVEQRQRLLTYGVQPG